MARLVGITLQALPDTDADAAKVTEVLSRAAVGLAMDGISADVKVVPYDHEPEVD